MLGENGSLQIRKPMLRTIDLSNANIKTTKTPSIISDNYRKIAADTTKLGGSSEPRGDQWSQATLRLLVGSVLK